MFGPKHLLIPFHKIDGMETASSMGCFAADVAMMSLLGWAIWMWWKHGGIACVGEKLNLVNAIEGEELWCSIKLLWQGIQTEFDCEKLISEESCSVATSKWGKVCFSSILVGLIPNNVFCWVSLKKRMHLWQRKAWTKLVWRIEKNKGLVGEMLLKWNL